MPRLAVSKNMAAFLDMLAVSEGTAGRGDDGYNVIVGGALFDSYNDHPRKMVMLPRYGINSSAAGRYQFLRRTWDDLAKMLRLPDFSPESQDRAVIELIRQCKAEGLVESGKFEAAVTACRRIWASLPGAGYGQRENRVEKLAAVYVKAGGSVA